MPGGCYKLIYPPRVTTYSSNLTMTNWNLLCSCGLKLSSLIVSVATGFGEACNLQINNTAWRIPAPPARTSAYRATLQNFHKNNKKCEENLRRRSLANANTARAKVVRQENPIVVPTVAHVEGIVALGVAIDVTNGAARALGAIRKAQSEAIDPTLPFKRWTFAP